MVDHLVSSCVPWGDLYKDATAKAFFADHGTIQERWYSTIVSETEKEVDGEGEGGDEAVRVDSVKARSNLPGSHSGGRENK